MAIIHDIAESECHARMGRGETRALHAAARLAGRLGGARGKRRHTRLRPAAWLHLLRPPCAGIVGDITPVCGVSDADKHAMEAAGMEKLRATLGGGLAADAMVELWKEYEAGATPEAAMVKDFDKVREGRVDGLTVFDHGGWLATGPVRPGEQGKRKGACSARLRSLMGCSHW